VGHFLTTVYSKSMFNFLESSMVEAGKVIKTRWIPANELASSQVTQQQQSPTNSQSQSQSAQEEQRSQPVCPWSAHAPPFGQSPSPFLRKDHALSTSATPAGELFLFGGYEPKSRKNDLFVISTQDFSTTLLQTSGDVPNPRYGHRAVLTSTTLLISGGKMDSSPSDQNAPNQSNDDCVFLLNLGASGLFDIKSPPADQSFLCSSIARVDPYRGQWSWARRSLQPYHDVGWFQDLHLRWSDRQEGFK
jgi:hypothetical protein